MLTSIAAFTVIALVVVLAPGADTILVLRTSLRDGPRAGTITATGIVCGPIIWGTLAGLGVALVFSQNALLYSAVAAAGGLYLGYLAYRTFASARSSWRAATSNTLENSLPSVSRRRSRAYLLTGLMTNLLNPKIGIFYLSVMPGLFLSQPITAWLGAFLGAIHSLLGLAFLSGVAAFSGFARRYVSQPKVQAVVETICGLCLSGVGVYVLAEAIMRSAGLGP